MLVPAPVNKQCAADYEVRCVVQFVQRLAAGPNQSDTVDASLFGHELSDHGVDFGQQRIKAVFIVFVHNFDQTA